MTLAQTLYGGDDPPVRVIRKAARTLVRIGFDTWGRDRWPLGPFQRWRVRTLRRKGRLNRGLSTK